MRDRIICNETLSQLKNFRTRAVHFQRIAVTEQKHMRLQKKLFATGCRSRENAELLTVMCSKGHCQTRLSVHSNHIRDEPVDEDAFFE